MGWLKGNADRRMSPGKRRRLVRALAARKPAERLAAAAALLDQPLEPEEVEALCPLLAEVAAGDEPAGIDLAVKIVRAFGQARWRRALRFLVPLATGEKIAPSLREAARSAAEAIQPAVTVPLGGASDAPEELKARTVTEQGLLVRGGLQALKGYLARMPLCGVFTIDEMPRMAAEETLRTTREAFADRRLRRDPDFSGTLDETSQVILEGLHAIAEELGQKSQISERAVIQPYRREGIPGLAEVRSFISEIGFSYVDLVARCDRDWFYYWGTED